MDTAETWQSTIGSIVRFALGGVVGSLVLKGVITQTQGEFITMEIIAGVITLGTIAWAHIKNTKQAKLVAAALDAAPGTAIEAVKTRAAMMK